jgi:hypothetical protein
MEQRAADITENATTEDATVAIFDTLGYARFLRDGGVASAQAETHAEAARQFIMADLATKDDLANGLENLGLRLSVRFGVMLAAGLSLMTAILGAMMRFR